MDPEFVELRVVPVALSAGARSVGNASVTEPQHAETLDGADHSPRLAHPPRASRQRAHLVSVRAGSGAHSIGDDPLRFSPADPIP